MKVNKTPRSARGCIGCGDIDAMKKRVGNNGLGVFTLSPPSTCFHLTLRASSVSLLSTSAMVSSVPVCHTSHPSRGVRLCLLFALDNVSNVGTNVGTRRVDTGSGKRCEESVRNKEDGD